MTSRDLVDKLKDIPKQEIKMLNGAVRFYIRLNGNEKILIMIIR